MVWFIIHQHKWVLSVFVLSLDYSSCLFQVLILSSLVCVLLKVKLIFELLPSFHLWKVLFWYLSFHHLNFYKSSSYFKCAIILWFGIIIYFYLSIVYSKEWITSIVWGKQDPTNILVVFLSWHSFDKGSNFITY